MVGYGWQGNVVRSSSEFRGDVMGYGNLSRCTQLATTAVGASGVCAGCGALVKQPTAVWPPSASSIRMQYSIWERVAGGSVLGSGVDALRRQIVDQCGARRLALRLSIACYVVNCCIGHCRQVIPTAH